MRARFSLNRRRLIETASASVAWIAAHGGVAFGGGGPAERKGSRPRILSLELLSSAPVAEMKAFYQGALGLSVRDEQRDRLTIAAGESLITFVETSEGKPFYHFAFNIPENKIVSALAWQRERTPLLPIPERLRDPKYPPEVVDYRHWNAHSIFFLDPAGNVVEYIARHDLGNAAAGNFRNTDILCVSEIGLIVDDVTAVASRLNAVAGTETYRGASDQFTALGDEHGLLLVMKRGRILNFNPSTDEKAARVFRTVARVRGVKPAKHLVVGYPYEVMVEG